MAAGVEAQFGADEIGGVIDDDAPFGGAGRRSRPAATPATRPPPRSAPPPRARPQRRCVAAALTAAAPPLARGWRQKGEQFGEAKARAGLDDEARLRGASLASGVTGGVITLGAQPAIAARRLGDALGVEQRGGRVAVGSRSSTAARILVRALDHDWASAQAGGRDRAEARENAAGRRGARRKTNAKNSTLKLARRWLRLHQP